MGKTLASLLGTLSLVAGLSFSSMTIGNIRKSLPDSEIEQYEKEREKIERERLEINEMYPDLRGNQVHSIGFGISAYGPLVTIRFDTNMDNFPDVNYVFPIMGRSLGVLEGEAHFKYFLAKPVIVGIDKDGSKSIEEGELTFLEDKTSVGFGGEYSLSNSKELFPALKADNITSVMVSEFEKKDYPIISVFYDTRKQDRIPDIFYSHLISSGSGGQFLLKHPSVVTFDEDGDGLFEDDPSIPLRYSIKGNQAS